MPAFFHLLTSPANFCYPVYTLIVIHCGACTLPEKEVQYRMRCCRDQGVPVTNYGILIAHLNGILRRTVEPFPDIAALLK